MSKRHNTSRRRSYGRRQHELHERMDRRTERRGERTLRTGNDMEPAAFETPTHAHFNYAD